MGKKFVLITIGIIVLFLTVAPKVHAEGLAGSSAQMNPDRVQLFCVAQPTTEVDYQIKKRVIKKVLEKYNSPLADSTDAFISTCEKYKLDCYLLPSIAGLESTYGKFIWPGSHNPFGWGGGYIMFDDWSKSIDAVGKGLRYNYINKGALTTEEIGRIYSESPTWATRVEIIRSQFEKEEQNNGLFFADLNVKL
ncbi:MAG: hypothetical protein Q7S61_03920 [bacterium]|nr:hypothetical protein [bacterium]